MSEAQSPAERDLGTRVTIDDLRELTGAATPHFAQQIRNRVARLIDGLPADDPVRRVGEAEIRRLTALGRSGEVRGGSAQPGMPGLPSTALPKG
ncbi:hypothetical protein [Patulibacter americanus]|jgi:hypothetical protein|uniref:hypothetical protein n=1 Tax=Patulibacter americanus TaxID=588672 RepID=UPI0003B302D1|nr:hypothetical protein [Patulibacter americanus]